MSLLQQSSLTEKGYEAYKEYLALKRHFTSSYDYFKYNGKVNASFDSFLARKDAFSFQKLGKKKDPRGLILSNLIENEKIWIGSLLEEQAKQVYLSWKGRQDSISEHLKSSLSVLDENFKENFIVERGAYPHLVDLYLQKKISLEVFCILVKLTKSQQYWDKEITDKVIYPSISRKIDKYHPFMVYSTEKIKKIVKDHFFD